jgi:hypothetical protein
MRVLFAAVLVSLACVCASAVELEPKVIGPTGGNVSDVSTAFFNGKFLTVWRQLFMPDVGIWGAFSDAEGVPLGPAFPIIPSTNALSLHLFAATDGFVLVWNDANRSSQFCRIDANGIATMQTTIGPPGLTDASATQNRIFFTRSGGSAIIDFEGRPVSSGVAVPFFAILGAGRDSFFATSRFSDPAVMRYSRDGALLQTYSIPGVTCKTANECAAVAAVRELDSGAVLVVVARQNVVESVTISPDSAVSPRHVVATAASAVLKASIQQSGAHVWLFLVDSDSAETRVDAVELDANGVAVGPLTTLIESRDAMGELFTFTEGGGTVFVASSPRSASRQVQTFAFRALTPVTPHVVSTTPSIQSNVQIASNGARFLALWEDVDGTRASRSHWATVDATGTPIGRIFEGSSGVVRHSLVSNGLDYLALLQSGTQLVARRIAFDGSLLGDTLIAEGGYRSSSDAAAVATPAGYVIVWQAGQTLNASLLTPNGIARPARSVAPAVTTRPDWISKWISPVLAWDGTAVLLAATNEQDFFALFPGYSNAAFASHAVLLTADGASIAASAVQLDPTFNSPTAAASSGSEYLVVGNGIAVIERDGTRLRVNYRDAGVRASNIVWDGREYAAAGPGGGRTALTLLARDGSIIRTAVRLWLGDVTIAADGAGDLVVTGAETDGRGPRRAVAYSASEFQPAAARPRGAAH